MMLGGYDYTITYKPGVEYASADLLCCLPLPQAPTYAPVPPETITLMETLSLITVTTKQVSQWTFHNAMLLKVKRVVLHG